MKTCSVCGRQFDPGYSWQKYCSPDCRKIIQHQKQREWYYANQAPLPVTIPCANCGLPFERKSVSHRYCRTCAEERLRAYKREFIRLYRAEGREDRSQWTEVSKEVRRERWQRYYQNNKKQILDRVRQTRYAQEQYPGERSQEYWTNRNHLILKLEAPCAVCGTRENLHAHHIGPVEDGGSDGLENLIVLCETHHIGSGTGFHSLGAEEFAARYGLWLGPGNEQ